MGIPEIIWRAVVQLASNNSSEDNILALTPHFHLHLPTPLGIRSPRCEQGAPLIPDARSTISISGETVLETTVIAKGNVSRFVAVLLCYR